ncbi:hypothetical protein EJ06DRAFT_526021 [Trichodelitschia bisporula]|uniref:Histone-lysine N-methyltransferase, H3 lysine-4 specific n=1 Tax=Trichodelitschia bisporula TaxID=703511 RepID=A0A6G1IB17_9PEZI|nr:hypothetical protein EJ06DRAFT_526021 [Trichodelitschia bisporula]
MSRSRNRLAEFFPNAPSVLQRERTKTASNAQSGSSSSNSLPRRDLTYVNTDSTTTPRASLGADNSLEDDDPQKASPSDTLTGIGSASSLSSAVSSVFSNQNNSALPQSGGTYNMSALTPLTNTESSPLRKESSPRLGKRTFDAMNDTDGLPTSLGSATMISPALANTITPIQTPPSPVRQARPGPGEVKGLKLVYDPETDVNLSHKDKRKYKPRWKEFGTENETSVPPDPRLAIAGYSAGTYHRRPSKAKLRIAPYVVKPYPFDKNVSVGRSPATKIVAHGFNPLTSDVKVRSLLASFGEIAEFMNHTDPVTGIFLGICSVTYRDKQPTRRGEVLIPATQAASRAEKEGSGHKMDQAIVKIERDPEGTRCRRYVDRALRAKREEREKMAKEEALKRVPPTPVVGPLEPPPNAPKGPSGKGVAMRPTVHPPPPTFQRPAAHALVESEPVIDSIKRQPFIFIAHCYVPVLGTTIAHMKKRLKAYHWKDVRCDPTGYFITFEQSKRGEDEAVRCHQGCNMQPLFTYTMNMDLQQFGNPNYVRSPSPERVAAEAKERAERLRIKMQDEEDYEKERQLRAEKLDTVRAALELLIPNLKEMVLKEIKAKVAVPEIYGLLAPERLEEKRTRLGIQPPIEAEPPRGFTGALSPYVGTPNARTGNHGGRKHLRAGHDRRRREEFMRPVNAFADERRRRTAPTRTRTMVPLHRRLLEFHDEESDDESHTPATLESEEQESRAQSVAPSHATLELDEDGLPVPKSKRRRLEAGWGAESDDEGLDAVARSTLGHLLDKEPEDMAMRELEQVLSTLPRSSGLRKRAAAEVRLRQKAAEDDELFFGGKKEDHTNHLEPAAGDTVPDSDNISIVESMEAVPAVRSTKAKKPKAKRKTKKQLLEERAALKAAAAREAADLADEAEHIDVKDSSDQTPALEPTPTIIEPHMDTPSATQWLPSTTLRRTVEDDDAVVMDVDGWQSYVKDDEDLQLLVSMLANVEPANIGDVELWVWKQKQAKALNNGGVYGIVRKENGIDGYYVPNGTGAARSEGVKKILESEKSKYLPHRIKVQKAREERQRQDKGNADVPTEDSKVSGAIAPGISSRSNRANNRRLVNEMVTHRGGDADSVRFNQLKKRKKLVKFDRSAIHNWGLYAEENITANDMIIEYVGQLVRQRVADDREKQYERQGIGSSYLFRIDEDTLIDATKKGGIARFINHSCMPNCTAKIIKVDGTKRIVIYALRDISKNEELTYDYKFEREWESDDRIPCLCGTTACKGFLN